MLFPAAEDSEAADSSSLMLRIEDPRGCGKQEMVRLCNMEDVIFTAGLVNSQDDEFLLITVSSYASFSASSTKDCRTRESPNKFWDIRVKKESGAVIVDIFWILVQCGDRDVIVPTLCAVLNSGRLLCFVHHGDSTGDGPEDVQSKMQSKHNSQGEEEKGGGMFATTMLPQLIEWGREDICDASEWLCLSASLGTFLVGGASAANVASCMSCDGNRFVVIASDGAAALFSLNSGETDDDRPEIGGLCLRLYVVNMFLVSQHQQQVSSLREKGGAPSHPSTLNGGSDAAESVNRSSQQETTDSSIVAATAISDTLYVLDSSGNVGIWGMSTCNSIPIAIISVLVNDSAVPSCNLMRRSEARRCLAVSPLQEWGAVITSGAHDRDDLIWFHPRVEFNRTLSFSASKTVDSAFRVISGGTRLTLTLPTDGRQDSSFLDILAASEDFLFLCRRQKVDGAGESLCTHIFICERWTSIVASHRVIVLDTPLIPVHISPADSGLASFAAGVGINDSRQELFILLEGCNQSRFLQFLMAKFGPEMTLGFAVSNGWDVSPMASSALDAALSSADPLRVHEAMKNLPPTEQLAALSKFVAWVKSDDGCRRVTSEADMQLMISVGLDMAAAIATRARKGTQDGIDLKQVAEHVQVFLDVKEKRRGKLAHPNAVITPSEESIPAVMEMGCHNGVLFQKSQQAGLDECYRLIAADRMDDACLLLEEHGLAPLRVMRNIMHRTRSSGIRSRIREFLRRESVSLTDGENTILEYLIQLEEALRNREFARHTVGAQTSSIASVSSLWDLELKGVDGGVFGNVSHEWPCLSMQHIVSWSQEERELVLAESRSGNSEDGWIRLLFAVCSADVARTAEALQPSNLEWLSNIPHGELRNRIQRLNHLAPRLLKRSLEAKLAANGVLFDEGPACTSHGDCGVCSACQEWGQKALRVLARDYMLSMSQGANTCMTARFHRYMLAAFADWQLPELATAYISWSASAAAVLADADDNHASLVAPQFQLPNRNVSNLDVCCGGLEGCQVGSCPHWLRVAAAIVSISKGNESGAIVYESARAYYYTDNDEKDGSLTDTGASLCLADNLGEESIHNEVRERNGIRLAADFEKESLESVLGLIRLAIARREYISALALIATATHQQWQQALPNHDADIDAIAALVATCADKVPGMRMLAILMDSDGIHGITPDVGVSFSNGKSSNADNTSYSSTESTTKSQDDPPVFFEFGHENGRTTTERAAAREDILRLLEDVLAAPLEDVERFSASSVTEIAKAVWGSLLESTSSEMARAWLCHGRTAEALHAFGMGFTFNESDPSTSNGGSRLPESILVEPARRKQSKAAAAAVARRVVLTEFASDVAVAASIIFLLACDMKEEACSIQLHALAFRLCSDPAIVQEFGLQSMEGQQDARSRVFEAAIHSSRPSGLMLRRLRHGQGPDAWRDHIHFLAREGRWVDLLLDADAVGISIEELWHVVKDHYVEGSVREHLLAAFRSSSQSEVLREVPEDGNLTPGSTIANKKSTSPSWVLHILRQATPPASFSAGQQLLRSAREHKCCVAALLAGCCSEITPLSAAYAWCLACGVQLEEKGNDVEAEDFLNALSALSSMRKDKWAEKCLAIFAPTSCLRLAFAMLAALVQRKFDAAHKYSREFLKVFFSLLPELTLDPKMTGRSSISASAKPASASQSHPFSSSDIVGSAGMKVTESDDDDDGGGGGGNNEHEDDDNDDGEIAHYPLAGIGPERIARFVIHLCQQAVQISDASGSWQHARLAKVVHSVDAELLLWMSQQGTIHPSPKSHQTGDDRFLSSPAASSSAGKGSPGGTPESWRLYRTGDRSKTSFREEIDATDISLSTIIREQRSSKLWRIESFRKNTWRQTERKLLEAKVAPLTALCWFLEHAAEVAKSAMEDCESVTSSVDSRSTTSAAGITGNLPHQNQVALNLLLPPPAETHSSGLQSALPLRIELEASTPAREGGDAERGGQEDVTHTPTRQPSPVFPSSPSVLGTPHSPASSSAASMPSPAMTATPASSIAARVPSSVASSSSAVSASTGGPLYGLMRSRSDLYNNTTRETPSGGATPASTMSSFGVAGGGGGGIFSAQSIDADHPQLNVSQGLHHAGRTQVTDVSVISSVLSSDPLHATVSEICLLLEIAAEVSQIAVFAGGQPAGLIHSVQTVRLILSVALEGRLLPSLQLVTDMTCTLLQQAQGKGTRSIAEVLADAKLNFIERLVRYLLRQRRDQDAETLCENLGFVSPTIAVINSCTALARGDDLTPEQSNLLGIDLKNAGQQRENAAMVETTLKRCSESDSPEVAERCRHILNLLRASQLLSVPYRAVDRSQVAIVIRHLLNLGSDAFPVIRELAVTSPQSSASIVKCFADAFIAGVYHFCVESNGGSADSHPPTLSPGKSRGVASLSPSKPRGITTPLGGSLLPLPSQLLPSKVGLMRPSEVPPGAKIGGILWTFAQLADYGRLSSNASLLAVELLDRLPTEIPPSTDRSILFVDLECLLLALACMASEGAVARQSELVSMLHQRCRLYQHRNQTKLLARAWLGASRGRRMDAVLHSLVGDNFELMLAGGVEKDEVALAAEGRALAGFIQDYYPDQVQTQCMIYLRHGLFGELGSLRFAHVQETIRLMRRNSEKKFDLAKLTDIARTLCEIAAELQMGERYKQAHSCLRLAALVALQARWPSFDLLNLDSRQDHVRRLMLNFPRFGDALVIAQAYELAAPEEWALPIFHQVVVSGNRNYFREYRRALVAPASLWNTITSAYCDHPQRMDVNFARRYVVLMHHLTDIELRSQLLQRAGPPKAAFMEAPEINEMRWAGPG